MIKTKYVIALSYLEKHVDMKEVSKIIYIMMEWNFLNLQGRVRSSTSIIMGIITVFD